jgi:cytochrome c-type protein NapC
MQRGDMHFPMLLLISLIIVTALLISVFVARPAVTATRGGKILAFVVLFLLPLLCMAMGFTSELERSKSTSFCLSCHIMEPHGRSLYVDDPSFLAAAHFQNHRVPADQACYTCHTNYAMFGGFRAKMHGLKHVYVQYLGTPPAPEAIKLYDPYNNRECLHCHEGARSFEEGAVHTADPELLPAVKSNKMSCLSSGCHQVVHNVGELGKVKFWRGAK